MQIKWSDDLLTGHAIIDEQHREIFARAEVFWEKGRFGDSGNQLHQMLQFFEDYTNQHLSQEEAMQQEKGYPDFEAHRKEHDDYRKQYLALKKQYRASGAHPYLGIKAVVFTIDWLTNHIKKTDKALAAYIRSQEPAKQTASK
jgi:hemerythrin